MKRYINKSKEHIRFGIEYDSFWLCSVIHYQYLTLSFMHYTITWMWGK